MARQSYIIQKYEPRGEKQTVEISKWQSKWVESCSNKYTEYKSSKNNKLSKKEQFLLWGRQILEVNISIQWHETQEDTSNSPEPKKIFHICTASQSLPTSTFIHIWNIFFGAGEFEVSYCVSLHYMLIFTSNICLPP